MRRLSIALLLLGTAGAAPLLGTKNSVYEGNFCKKYGCDLVELIPLDNEKIHAYKLKNNLKLEVLRRSDNTITSAALYGLPEQLKNSITTDFTRSFVGLTFESSTVNKCLSTASPIYDNHFFTGFIKDRDFQVACDRPTWKSSTVSFGAALVKHF